MKRQALPLLLVLVVFGGASAVPRDSFGWIGASLRGLDSYYDRSDGIGEAPCAARHPRRVEGPEGTEFEVPECWVAKVQPGGLLVFSDPSLKLGVVTVLVRRIPNPVEPEGAFRARRIAYSNANVTRAQQYFAWKLTNGRLDVRVFYVVAKDLLRHPALAAELDATGRVASSVRQVPEAAAR